MIHQFGQHSGLLLLQAMMDKSAPILFLSKPGNVAILNWWIPKNSRFRYVYFTVSWLHYRYGILSVQSEKNRALLCQFKHPNQSICAVKKCLFVPKIHSKVAWICGPSLEFFFKSQPHSPLFLYKMHCICWLGIHFIKSKIDLYNIKTLGKILIYLRWAGECTKSLTG